MKTVPFRFLVSTLLLSCLLGAAIAINREPKYYRLPSLGEQAVLKDSWTKERIERIPELLVKYGVDVWLISQKEYAEDTVFFPLKPATAFSARRRTLTLHVAHPLPNQPASYTWIDNTPSVFDNVKAFFEIYNPSKIAINVDSNIAFASGMHVGELQLIKESVGGYWNERYVSIPELAVEVVATMPVAQLEWYEKMQSTAWAIIRAGFSEEGIEVGVTTMTDLEWWLREKIQELGYTTWFMPSVSILPIDEGLAKEGGLGEQQTALGFQWESQENGTVINEGDLLHVDFGVTAMGLNTDTQHMAYVLKKSEGESEVPNGYKQGLKKAQKMQDIMREEMVIGKTGNEILKNIKKRMKSVGIEGSVYGHPIGDWGHSAGTLIGMTNLQDGVPILGDLPLLKDSYFSVELFAEHFVEERNQTLKFYLEEDVYWNRESESWEWVFGRQEGFWIVNRHGGKGSLNIQQELK